MHYIIGKLQGVLVPAQLRYNVGGRGDTSRPSATRIIPFLLLWGIATAESTFNSISSSSSCRFFLFYLFFGRRINGRRRRRRNIYYINSFWTNGRLPKATSQRQASLYERIDRRSRGSMLYRRQDSIAAATQDCFFH